MSEVCPTVHSLAFEIGTEEIPAFDLHRANAQLFEITRQLLEQNRLSYSDITVGSTPRRLIVLVEGLSDASQVLSESFRGPSASIAFDSQGKPTSAAVGFAKSKGVELSSLEIREEKAARYVYATRTIEAKKSFDLLPGILLKIMEGLSWPKSCRWGSTHEWFSRPVRWICALLDDELIPLSYANISSGKLTWGHRFMAKGPHAVSHASKLLEVLRGAFVIPFEDERREIILRSVRNIEQKCGLRAQIPENTLLEVSNLCEYPCVLKGNFDEEFLAVPPEIIVDAMLKHQRYFPMYDADGCLSSTFLVVANGNPAYSDLIVEGNERVVRARLSDAKFFYTEDVKQPLEFYVEKLKSVVFQEGLGSLYEKTLRNVELARYLAQSVQLDAQSIDCVLRAAYLAKADLVTNAVVEFTSVQGIMGGYYAQAHGENALVVKAIAQHYYPRFARDAVPEDKVGKTLALADKLDTVCALFAIGQIPTGSSDPFALRRAALGIITILAGLRDNQTYEFNLSDAIDCALKNLRAQGIEFDEQRAIAKIKDFFITRTRVLLRDEGCEADTIDAVLATSCDEPFELIGRVHALEKARNDDPATFNDLALAYSRANNLCDASLGKALNEDLLSAVEKNLFESARTANASCEQALQLGQLQAALLALASLREPLDAFFAEVMVMDENLELRQNRLCLLNYLVEVFFSFADFSKLAKV